MSCPPALGGLTHSHSKCPRLTAAVLLFPPSQAAKKQKAADKTPAAVKKPAAAAAAAADGASSTCFVGNLSWGTQEDGLKKHFKDCGKVVSVRVGEWHPLCVCVCGFWKIEEALQGLRQGC